MEDIFDSYYLEQDCTDCHGFNTSITQFIQCGYGYYDDEGWWALVWVKAYEFTRLNGTADLNIPRHS